MAGGGGIKRRSFHKRHNVHEGLRSIKGGCAGCIKGAWSVKGAGSFKSTGSIKGRVPLKGAVFIKV